MKPIDIQNKSGRFNSLDTIRGLAALFVFIYHFHGEFPDIALFNSFKLIGISGHIGLDIFFVLSGFLIFRAIYLHGVNKEYFIRRLLRIVPIYYFSLAVVLFFLDQSFFFSIEGWKNILSHVFFLHSFSESTYYGINPVLWSLSVEMIFYIFLPIFFLIFGRKHMHMLIGILLMMILSWIYRYQIVSFYDQWNVTQRVIFTENFIGRLDQFAFGMLASLATIKLNINSFLKGKTLHLLSFVLIIIGVLGMIFGMMLFAKFQSGFREILLLQIFLHSFIALSVALIIFGLCNSFKIISSIVGNRLFVFLGIISYSFYIWHAILTKKVEEFSANSIFQGHEFLASFFITLIFSTITYYMIERVFLAKSRYKSAITQKVE